MFFLFKSPYKVIENRDLNNIIEETEIEENENRTEKIEEDEIKIENEANLVDSEAVNKILNCEPYTTTIEKYDHVLSFSETQPPYILKTTSEFEIIGYNEDNMCESVEKMSIEFIVDKKTTLDFFENITKKQKHDMSGQFIILGHFLEILDVEDEAEDEPLVIKIKEGGEEELETLIKQQKEIAKKYYEEILLENEETYLTIKESTTNQEPSLTTQYCSYNDNNVILTYLGLNIDEISFEDYIKTYFLENISSRSTLTSSISEYTWGICESETEQKEQVVVIK